MNENLEAEGGCGVIGFACAEKQAGKHLLPALSQMCNRGNGKGGGIAAVGLSAEAFGVNADILANDYLLAIAYLDPACRAELERDYIQPLFTIDHIHTMPHLADYHSLKRLDVKPPDVVVYFVRVKPEVKEQQKRSEDDIVYQNSYRLNHAFYVSTGEKRAFVLSHGKNILVLKMVGFGDDVIRYYQLEDFKAHVWIGHHRYPTKGNVWHPGGAHPFVGLNEALVHNGDFANYYSICEYLAQRGIYPQFLTDTEVSVLMFDLLYRTYRYPLEYVIETLAPTTERDFTLLPQDKQHIYQMLQATHIHGSPDGPWFFLIAQSVPAPQAIAYRLIGITDTSMLRPQVFALQQGPIPIGFSASEKQAIDATLQSLANEDKRFWNCADHYWNARGGSYTDGGAFSFTVTPGKEGKTHFACTDKFGNPVHAQPLPPPFTAGATTITTPSPDLPTQELFTWVASQLVHWNYATVQAFLDHISKKSHDDATCQRAIDVLTLLLDRRYPLGNKRRSSVTAMIQESLINLFTALNGSSSTQFIYMSYGSPLPHPKGDKQTLVLRAAGFPMEGTGSLAMTIIELYKRGFNKIIVFDCQGQRFIANGLGPHSHALHIDIYGSSGDYIASGIDGATVHVHGHAQDQAGQIMKTGTFVVHGDVGQTLMYGAKGGKAFIKGNTAGRPLIYIVGKPRVVINGTALDYLAESCMAGDPLQGGGFVIVNGIRLDDEGGIQELNTPYPGSNLFSLASGGAIYLRDPGQRVQEDQLNGGIFEELNAHDWEHIHPYLEENARHFDIPVAKLLEYQGKALPYHQVYRKIRPLLVRALQEEEAWVKARD